MREAIITVLFGAVLASVMPRHAQPVSSDSYLERRLAKETARADVAMAALEEIQEERETAPETQQPPMMAREEYVSAMTSMEERLARLETQLSETTGALSRANLEVAELRQKQAPRNNDGPPKPVAAAPQYASRQVFGGGCNGLFCNMAQRRASRRGW